MTRDDEEKRARLEMARTHRELAARLEAGDIGVEQITDVMKQLNAAHKDYTRGVERKRSVS